MLTPHTAKPCRKAQDANLDSFNLAGAKEKLRFLQSKVVSQTETGPPGPTSRLEGKSLSDVLMVEIFAGSARLAKACKHMGCRSVAVDKTTDRSHGTKIFVCDVTNPDELTMLEQFLQAEVQNLGWVNLPQLAEQHPKPGKSQTGFWSAPVFTCPSHLGQRSTL